MTSAARDTDAVEAGVIDTCVHHTWGDVEEVLGYLDEGWRGYVGKPRSLPNNAGMRNWIPRSRFPNPFGEYLAGAEPGPGAPASSVDALARTHLEPNAIARALLLFDRAMFVPANPNPYLASGLVEAINNWSIDRWLGRDDRLYGAALVPSQTPDVAARELRRIGDHPQIVAVLLAAPALGKSLGHPVYHPIYEGAAELDLTIVLHSGGDGLLDIPAGPAGGTPLTFAEYHALAPMALVSQLLSLIANGVLDQHPELRVYLVGAGISWIPGFLGRFELLARALRREVPWMRRSGTEYLEQQVRTSTYGIELGPHEGILSRILEANSGLAELTLYGSGFPSWDTVSCGRVAEAFGESRSARVLAGGADEWFPWDR